jgi:hypothetical protein
MQIILKSYTEARKNSCESWLRRRGKSHERKKNFSLKKKGEKYILKS